MVDRARSGVILTRVGEETVRRAEDVLVRVEDLVQAARSAGQPLSGRLRLGVIPTIAPFLLPRALPLLRERFPRLRLFLREDLTGKLVAALKSGALDAALIALPYDTAGLETAEVRRDELMAATPKNHPFTRTAEVSVDALEAEDVILLEDGHCLRDHALAACTFDTVRGEAGGFAATSLHTLVQMVGSGLGVTLLPALAVDAGLAAQAGVEVRPLRAAGAHRDLVVAWRSGLLARDRGAAAGRNAARDLIAAVRAPA